MKWFIFLLATSMFANVPCEHEGKLFPVIPCEKEGVYFVSNVSILAWQAIIGGLEFALKNNPLPIKAETNVNGSLIGPDFSWKPAFKLDAGLFFTNRAWDAIFRWTYFQSTSTRTIQTRAPEILPLWAFPGANMATEFLYGKAKASYDLNMNMMDIEMAYHPFLTPTFSWRFITGLKVVQIAQNYDIDYSDGFNDGIVELINAHAKIAHNSIGAGPRLGFLTEWRLHKGFSVLGSMVGALPLWHMRVSRQDNDLNIQAGVPYTIDAFTYNRFWIFRSILETSLGLGWDTCFGCRSQYPFGINANYELQFFSEQNMMSMLVNPGSMSKTFMPRGDLILHGLTLTFHFGF